MVDTLLHKLSLSNVVTDKEGAALHMLEGVFTVFFRFFKSISDADDACCTGSGGEDLVAFLVDHCIVDHCAFAGNGFFINADLKASLRLGTVTLWNHIFADCGFVGERDTLGV